MEIIWPRSTAFSVSFGVVVRDGRVWVKSGDVMPWSLPYDTTIFAKRTGLCNSRRILYLRKKNSNLNQCCCSQRSTDTKELHLRKHRKRQQMRRGGRTSFWGTQLCLQDMASIHKFFSKTKKDAIPYNSLFQFSTAAKISHITNSSSFFTSDVYLFILFLIILAKFTWLLGIGTDQENPVQFIFCDPVIPD